jgi:hypothetical protein
MQQTHASLIESFIDTGSRKIKFQEQYFKHKQEVAMGLSKSNFNVTNERLYNIKTTNCSVSAMCGCRCELRTFGSQFIIFYKRQ